MNNSIEINGMFLLCKSSNSLHDLSKWDTHNVKDISDMFSNCSKLESLPDISK